MTDADFQVLDLFAGLGGFSSAFADSPRWDVTTVDIDPEFDPDIIADVMELDPDGLPDADVILASPPCVDFSMACMAQKWDTDPNRRPRYVPKWESIGESVHLVFRTMWLINQLDPEYWWLENPWTGVLKQIIGEPEYRVDYCQYGSEFRKPTGLWGWTPPFTARTCVGARCGHVSNPRESNAFRDGTSDAARLGDVEQSAERAKVPFELSASIRDACERALDGDAAEQATLAEATSR